jgi:hypothetical protein
LISDWKKYVLKRIKHEPEALEDFLNTTVQDKLKSNDSGEILRANSPLIKILKTAAERHKRYIESNHSKVQQIRKELTNIMNELNDEAAVKFEENVPGACSLEVDKIASEIIITPSKRSKKERDVVMARTIVIDKPINQTTTFYFNGKLVQRLA